MKGVKRSSSGWNSHWLRREAVTEQLSVFLDGVVIVLLSCELYPTLPPE